MLTVRELYSFLWEGAGKRPHTCSCSRALLCTTCSVLGEFTKWACCCVASHLSMWVHLIMFQKRHFTMKDLVQCVKCSIAAYYDSHCWSNNSSLTRIGLRETPAVNHFMGRIPNTERWVQAPSGEPFLHSELKFCWGLGYTPPSVSYPALSSP